MTIPESAAGKTVVVWAPAAGLLTMCFKRNNESRILDLSSESKAQSDVDSWTRRVVKTNCCISCLAWLGMVRHGRLGFCPEALAGWSDAMDYPHYMVLVLKCKRMHVIIVIGMSYVSHVSLPFFWTLILEHSRKCGPLQD